MNILLSLAMIGLCKINISNKLGIGMIWYEQSVYTFVRIHELMEESIVENIWIKTEIRKEGNERKQTKMKHKTHTNKKHKVI